MVAKPVAVGVVGVIVLASALVLNYFVLPGEESETATAVVPPSAAPASKPAAKPASKPAESPPATAAAGREQAAATTGTAPAGPARPVEPSFDVVRVDPEGNAVLAGRGAPNAEIAIMDGGEEVGRVTVDTRGEWVFVPPSKLPPGQRMLHLRQFGAGQAASSGEVSDTVVLVIPEKGKDIAGRPSAEPGVPLVMVVPKDDPASAGKAVARVLQAPAAGPLAGTGQTGTGQTGTGQTGTGQTGTGQTGTGQTAVASEGAAAGRAANGAGSAASAASAPAASVAAGGTADRQPAAGQTAPGQTAAGQTANGQTAAAPAPAGGATPESAAAPTAIATAQPGADATGAAGGSAGTAGAPTPQDAAGDTAAARQLASLPQAVAGGSGAAPATTDGAAGPASSSPAASSPAASAVAGSGTAAPAPAAGPAAAGPAATAPAPTVSAFPEPVPSASAAAASTAADKVAVDVIDYDEKGDVVFSGRSEPGARVEVFIDDKKVGAAGADAKGRWTMQPEAPVAPGSYQLRVDKVAATGTIEARVAFPFVRADPLTELPSNRLVVIQPGNNLWRIATRVYGSGVRYVEIFDANKDQILDPDLIYPGQVFGLPRTN